MRMYKMDHSDLIVHVYRFLEIFIGLKEVYA